MERKGTWATWATWVLLVPGDLPVRTGCRANQDNQDILGNLASLPQMSIF